MQEINTYEIQVAESTPSGYTKLRRLQKGDSFVIKSSDPVKIGESYENPYAIITRIYYEPRKWWQFWKKKRQIGFQVTWTME